MLIEPRLPLIVNNPFFNLLSTLRLSPVCSSRLLLLQAPNAEKRIENRLASADRAFAGRRHPVALGKDETTVAALGRSYLQHRAGGVEAAADMLEMGVDLFFREVG